MQYILIMNRIHVYPLVMWSVKPQSTDHTLVWLYMQMLLLHVPVQCLSASPMEITLLTVGLQISLIYKAATIWLRPFWYAWASSSRLQWPTLVSYIWSHWPPSMQTRPLHWGWGSFSRCQWPSLWVQTCEQFRMSLARNARILLHLASCTMQTTTPLMGWQVQWFTAQGVISGRLYCWLIILSHNVTVHDTLFQNYDSKVIMLDSCTSWWPHVSMLNQVQVYSSCLTCGPYLKTIQYASSLKNGPVILPILTSCGPPR